MFSDDEEKFLREVERKCPNRRAHAKAWYCQRAPHSVVRNEKHELALVYLGHSVFASLGCHLKRPYSGWLQQQKLFLKILEAESPQSRWALLQFLQEFSWFANTSCLSCPHRAERERCLFSFSLSLLLLFLLPLLLPPSFPSVSPKATNPVRLKPHLMPITSPIPSNSVTVGI